MNAVTGATRKFDDWPDDTSPSWAPATMFASPFGEDMPVPESQFWATPGNSTEGYYKPNPPPARQELEHGIGAGDSLNAGFTVNNIATSPGSFMFNHHPGTHPARQSNDYRYDGSNRHEYFDSATANDGTMFNENDPSSPNLPTSASSQRYSPQSSENMGFSPQSTSAVSPASGVSVEWMATGSIDRESHTSPSSIDVAATSPTASAVVPTAAPRSRRNRERNRVAAHKCRQKAKHSLSELQAREVELSAQNRMLQDHAVSLRDEILDLKNEILRHSSCDSDIIQNYIVRAARDVH
ncbi:hypothetical protein GGS26DRAFT_597116 [Hypomontagnella submonticulosa]|nr:hypothetical protein GGS26DRAFT_597116 [Hypomontagnella submonticulosa]